ncbi:hypothetical protein FRC07_001835 [Ceratobasidium sp. 392]|nr:hypothetical protein FRC07_001835 [Ceratobasidium sp. 392]
MAPDQEHPIPCPYTVGTAFRLQVTPFMGTTFEAQVIIMKVYIPFTISPAMKVSLDSPACTQVADRPTLPFKLPSELVFKVYDRRFALALRKRYSLQPPTYESEARYSQYVASGRAPVGATAVSDEIDAACTDGTESCPPELLELLATTKIHPHFESERAVYQRLENLQGRDIPIFFGSTQFLDGSPVPGLSLSVPGVLLEAIPGITLEDVDPRSIDVSAVLNSALRIVDTCGDLGVLNRDVRLGNFIVKPDSSVVMIDFAQTRFRRADKNDLDWKRAKWSEDEEGSLPQHLPPSEGSYRDQRP